MRHAVAKIFSAEVEGITARVIEVEVDMHVGLPSFSIVGLADKAVSEAKERVAAALKNTDCKPPTSENRTVTVNLAPADVKKNGSLHDVAIALGYLISSAQIGQSDVAHALFVGELALDGAVRPVPGILNICLMARQKGFLVAYIPRHNCAEVAFIDGIQIIPLDSLGGLIEHLEGKNPIDACKASPFIPGVDVGGVDMADVRGHDAAKRALTIAAAGGHNIIFSGPPGAGKTMLAQSLISILPPLSFAEALEITGVYSAAGLLVGQPFITRRPFRAPHHSASLVSLVGGGQNPRPGEISLAHRGVLFMDEIPEFHRDVLESLRQPLEDRVVHVARSKNTVVFPSDFLLVAAANPCPCGYYQDDKRACTCSAYDIIRYHKKISGPLLDRIDLHVWIGRIASDDLRAAITDDHQTSAYVRARVTAARMKQAARYDMAGVHAQMNGSLSSKDATRCVRVTPSAQRMLDVLLDQAHVSTRGYFKLLKIAQTIADIDDKDVVDDVCVQEAFSYRMPSNLPA